MVKSLFTFSATFVSPENSLLLLTKMFYKLFTKIICKNCTHAYKHINAYKNILIKIWCFAYKHRIFFSEKTHKKTPQMMKGLKFHVKKVVENVKKNILIFFKNLFGSK